MTKFQLKLLEKIEELTLYTLAQDKQIAEQQAKIEALQQQQMDVSARLATLEEHQ